MQSCLESQSFHWTFIRLSRELSENNNSVIPKCFELQRKAIVEAKFLQECTKSFILILKIGKNQSVFFSSCCSRELTED